jgi:hypothetical protein
MALSIQRWEADGIQKTFGFNFGYLSRSHVFVFVNNTLAAFKWTGDFQVELLVTPLPAEVVTIRRLTDRANRVTTFTDGQTLLAQSLNAGDLQVFYIAQEMIDQIEEGVVAGDVSVINPGSGYITAAWIQAQLEANLAAAPQFGAIDDALAAEAIARANALAAETLARGQALAAEAATRTAAVSALTAADAAAYGRLDVIEADLNTPTTGVKAKIITVENAVATETTARATADTAILAEINTPSTGLKARATSLESRVTSVEANKAEASALTALTTRVGTAESAIATEATTRSTADSALSTQIGSLSARVGTAEADINAVEVAVATETAARASADTAIQAQLTTPVTGLTARATALESRVAVVETNKAEVTALNSLTARVGTAESAIATEATARSNGDAANATLVSALRAETHSRTSLGLNPYFDAPSASPGFPPGWTDWIAGATTTQVTKSAPPNVGFNARMVVPSATSFVGLSQYITLGGVWSQRRIAVRAQVRLVAGNFDGAGVYVAFYTAGYATHLGNAWLKFSTEANTSGIISNSHAGRTTYEKTFVCPANTAHIILYPMANYPSELGTGTAKSLDWYECSISEVGAGVAGVSDLREAITTGSSSLARLLLAVNTATNAATIEAAAFAGDGAWNGSAITLNADLIKLMAKSINFGTNTVFEDTKGSIYTTSAGRRLRILGPFGTSNDLVIWYGPTSVALNSETKTNGHFAFATDGKVYYGNAELGGGGSSVSAKTATGSANVSSAGAWTSVCSVAFPNVSNPSFYKFPYVDLAGVGAADGTGRNANWYWRIMAYPSGNPGVATLLAYDYFTTVAGGAGEPVTVNSITQPAPRLNSPVHYGSTILELQIYRFSGSGTVPIQGTIYVENIPG